MVPVAQVIKCRRCFRESPQVPPQHRKREKWVTGDPRYCSGCAAWLNDRQIAGINDTIQDRGIHIFIVRSKLVRREAYLSQELIFREFSRFRLARRDALGVDTT